MKAVRRQGIGEAAERDAVQEGRRGVEGVAGYVRTCIWHLAIVTFGFVSASLLSVRLSDCTGVGLCVCVCA